MTENEQIELAAQLKKPHGAQADIIAQRMNKGNAFMNKKTIQFLRLNNYHRVLEIGMANGYFVNDVLTQAKNITYIGLDFSEEMVAAANQLNKHFVDQKLASFICGNISDVFKLNQTFDKIFTVNTLYFWEDPNQVLQALKKCLTASGELVITIRPKKIMLQYPFVKYGFSMYSEEDLINLLVSNGYTILEIQNEKEPDQEIFGVTYTVETLMIKACCN
jgi:SAM-dependent methyltransferase